MTMRRLLPNRRPCQTIAFDANGLHYTATYGFFGDGTLAEVFLCNHKAGNDADTNARDAAIACSFALQHGTDLDALRSALSRDAQGRATGVLGAALDLIAKEAAK